MPDRELAHGSATASARAPVISRRVLIASSAFGPRLPAERVIAAIARGLLAGGLPEPDRCVLDERAQAPRAKLAELDLEARMRASHAVIIGDRLLREQTLVGSTTFEIATSARQAGVPAYAVTTHNQLDAFDARILDLQLILEADSARALAAAGRRLAAVV